MNHCNGRLILKVKKRRNTIPAPSKYTQSTDKENKCVTSQQRSLKRPNPFTKTHQEPIEKVKANLNDCNQELQNKFLLGLSKTTDTNKKTRNNEVSYELQINDKTSNEDVDKKDVTITYNDQRIPLDWTIKHKIRFFSGIPFKCDSKPASDSKGISQFARAAEEDRNICQYLYNWIHPSLPGLPNYPLKTTSLGNSTKEEKSSINMLANNVELQEIVMKHWKVSFQSLFNMLKFSRCPYFYLCCHQFTVVFKAAGVGSKQMSAIMGPTTKGLRDLLEEEGLAFKFFHKPKSENCKEIEFGFEEESGEQKTEECTSLNTSCGEDFFDSIGLNKKEHFPQMEQQERLSLRSKLNLIDNRPASVVKIKNCHGLFNFLLNANFLCASSGPLTGVPPTLFAPTAFEGAALSKCKINSGPMKQQKKSAFETVYTLDVNGFVLPGQLFNLTKMLTVDDVSRESVTIHMKTFEALQCFAGDQEEVENDWSSKISGVSEDLMGYLNQTPKLIPDSKEIVYQNGLFSY